MAEEKIQWDVMQSDDMAGVGLDWIGPVREISWTEGLGAGLVLRRGLGTRVISQTHSNKVYVDRSIDRCRLATKCQHV